VNDSKSSVGVMFFVVKSWSLFLRANFQFANFPFILLTVSIALVNAVGRTVEADPSEEVLLFFADFGIFCGDGVFR